MPTAIQTYGVTPALISARVQSFTISANTTPSTSAAEDVILEQAALVNSRLLALGIEPEGISADTNSYLMLRGIVMDLAIAVLVPSRTRQSEVIDPVERRIDRAIEALRRGPNGLGESREQSPIRANTSASKRREVEEFNRTDAPLGTRMATRRFL